MDAFALQTEARDTCVVLAIAGEVDLGTAPDLREKLFELVADGHRHIVVDLSDTEFMDSTGLGALVAGLKRLRAHNGDMRLVCTTARIRKVFEITHVDRVIPMFESVDAASADLAAPGDGDGTSSTPPDDATA